MARRPARLTAASFVVAALLGAVLLSLPAARTTTARGAFLDDLFTAVSAVCVTGLTVSDVAATYNQFGHSIILVLMQIGGTGIMVISSALLMLAGGRLGLRSRAALAEAVEAPSIFELSRTLRAVMMVTVVIEAAGAFALFAVFSNRPEIEGPAFAALFHSVSAFCNAGFTTLPQGLLPFAGSIPVTLIFSVLIALGGIGFPVLDELIRRVRDRFRGRRPDRLSLHTRAAVVVSLVLTAGGAILLAAIMKPPDPALTTSQRAWVALFQAVSARTAGFSMIDLSTAAPASLMVLGTLMFIGASPGSTGGGIKTTTLAVLTASFRSELIGSKSPEILDRRLPLVALRRALAVFFASATVVALLTFILLLTESAPSEALAFEAVSAFATAGLSAGATGELSTIGKVAIIVTMLVGRIGPVTVALALAEDVEAKRRELPHEGVLIG